MLMHLFGVNDCRRLFSNKMYRVVTMTFPIRDANDINTNTATAAIRPVDIDEGLLQLDGGQCCMSSLVEKMMEQV